jgi:hypothetical protein
MKINMNAPLYTLGGKQLTLPAPENTPLTLREVCAAALQGAYEDERTLSGEEKAKRLRLILRLNKQTPCNMTTEEVVLVKACVAKAYGVLVVGQAWELLEGKRGPIGPAAEGEEPEEPVEATDTPS